MMAAAMALLLVVGNGIRRKADLAAMLSFVYVAARAKLCETGGNVIYHVSQTVQLLKA